MPSVSEEFAPALPPREVGSSGVVHVLGDNSPPEAGRVLPHGHELEFRILTFVSGADPRAECDAEALVDHRSLARLLWPVKQRPTGSRAKAPGQVRYDRLEPIESFQRRPNNFHLTASKQGVDQPEVLQLLGAKHGELVKKLF